MASYQALKQYITVAPVSSPEVSPYLADVLSAGPDSGLSDGVRVVIDATLCGADVQIVDGSTVYRIVDSHKVVAIVHP